MAIISPGMKENDDLLEKEPYKTILKNIDDPLGKILYKKFIEKFGDLLPDFDGEGHVGHDGQAYWVRKNGSYRSYDPNEKLW